MSQLYPVLHDLHYWGSRLGIIIALIMFVVGFIIGVVRKKDVTLWYRRATYTIVGIMVFQCLTGLVMYFGVGVRPYEEVHLIYGLGAVLALPFFIFVEVTAKKRPAMGSYIWGFAVLAGILLRGILTGAA